MYFNCALIYVSVWASLLRQISCEDDPCLPLTNSIITECSDYMWPPGFVMIFVLWLHSLKAPCSLIMKHLWVLTDSANGDTGVYECIPRSPAYVFLGAAPRRVGWSSPWWWRCSSSWGCSPDSTTSSSSSCSTQSTARLGGTQPGATNEKGFAYGSVCFIWTTCESSRTSCSATTYYTYTTKKKCQE